MQWREGLAGCAPTGRRHVQCRQRRQHGGKRDHGECVPEGQQAVGGARHIVVAQHARLNLRGGRAARGAV
jgi:hypothetical protein